SWLRLTAPWYSTVPASGRRSHVRSHEGHDEHKEHKAAVRRSACCAGRSTWCEPPIASHSGHAWWLAIDGSHHVPPPKAAPSNRCAACGGAFTLRRVEDPAHESALCSSCSSCSLWSIRRLRD